MDTWMDKYIVYNEKIKRFIAYDESQLEIGRYFTREAAEIALRHYNRRLLNDRYVTK